MYGTVDAGASWQLRGVVPGTDGIPTTLDLAASQAGRLAVAGSFSDAGTLRGYVAVSDDDGATWRRTVVALEGASGLFLSAFDPLDAGRLYARTSGGGAGDRLLVSTDAGLSFAELTRVDGAMLGFALSPDGGQVAVGGPLAGLRVAARGSSAFAPVRAAATTCLAWTTEGLYACGTGTGGDFAVGRSLDAGASWQPVLARLGDLASPGSRCAASTDVATACEPRWPAPPAPPAEPTASSSAFCAGHRGSHAVATSVDAAHRLPGDARSP
ncbi:MAG: exo-alpha-sialidase, partial [Propionibacteriaceae bacterium]